MISAYFSPMLALTNTNPSSKSWEPYIPTPTMPIWNVQPTPKNASGKQNHLDERLYEPNNNYLRFSPESVSFVQHGSLWQSQHMSTIWPMVVPHSTLFSHFHVAGAAQIKVFPFLSQNLIERLEQISTENQLNSIRVGLSQSSINDQVLILCIVIYP